jgi:hypothetical protein
MNINALILHNTSSPHYRDAIVYVLPYLDHFDIPYQSWDINRAPLPSNLGDFSLVVIAHPQIDPQGHQLSHLRLRKAIEAGTGLVTFDPVFDLAGGQDADGSSLHQQVVSSRPGFSTQGASVTFNGHHPITSLHVPDETISLAASLHLQPVTGEEVLLTSDGSPLLAVTSQGAGRIVQWASTDWMDTHYLGSLGGLDDVLWRSLVWAARKPFVLRGLPPLVTMRVDDVAGTGHLWGQSPLWWVHTAIRYGFKPWLGLFPFNLTEPAITELRELLLNGKTTAFPHAFGRPLRSLTPLPSPFGGGEQDPSSSGGWGQDPSPAGRGDWGEGITSDPCPYYNPAGFPLRSTAYDEFIYYDHEHQRPWFDTEAARGLAAIDAWYAAHAPLPMSSYAIAHWGEMGSNTLAHVRDRWGCEFIATYHGADAPLDGASWLVAGPFRLHEQPGSALFDKSDRGARSLYYADFINFAGRRFFLCCTEIRDETGYEWAPDADVEQSAARGLRQVRRALDSFALPVLFTHETDYIYKISPAAWDGQLERISSGLSAYNPIYVTLDEGVRYVRATKTSRLESATYDPARREVAVHFAGQADVLTHYHLFTSEEEISARLVEVPPFTDGCVVKHTNTLNLSTKV